MSAKAIREFDGKRLLAKHIDASKFKFQTSNKNVLVQFLSLIPPPSYFYFFPFFVLNFWFFFQFFAFSLFFFQNF